MYIQNIYVLHIFNNVHSCKYALIGSAEYHRYDEHWKQIMFGTFTVI